MYHKTQTQHYLVEMYLHQLCAHHTFPYSRGRKHPSAGVTVDVTSVLFLFIQPVSQWKCLFSEGVSAACDSLKTWRILSAENTRSSTEGRILLTATTSADSCKQKRCICVRSLQGVEMFGLKITKQHYSHKKREQCKRNWRTGNNNSALGDCRQDITIDHLVSCGWQNTI